MNAARRPLPAAVSFFVFLSVCLAGALLSGCGGGGSSTTDEGFRFVPDGQGAVVPYANVHFEYDSGSVSSGVVVAAAPVTTGLPAAPSGAAQLGSAFQVTFSTPSLAFRTPARIYLPYDPAQLPVGSVPRIYISVPVATGTRTWQALPVSTAAPAPTSSTILEALLQVPGNPPTATLPSGSFLALFAGTPSGLTPLNPFFGIYTLTDSSSPPVVFRFAVAADGTVSGVTGGPVVTGTVSTAGAVSLVSAGQTYTGTVALDAAGTVTASSTAISGTAGTWSLQ